MTISPTTGIDPALAAMMSSPNAANAKTGGSELDGDAFLKLLVAQLKYQDPSKPVDSSQMMAQTAQFTMVQKMEAMATDTSSSLGIQQGMAASSLVGRSISWLGPDGLAQQGTVDSASFGGAVAGEPILRVGSHAVLLSQVTGVNATTAAGADPGTA